MAARRIDAWTGIAMIACLAFVIFSGLSYFRIWGTRFVTYAVGEVIFFAALIGFVFLLARVFGVFQRKGSGQP